MRVIQTIQSQVGFLHGVEENTNAPVEIPFYTGDSLAHAISAVASIVASAEDDTPFTRTLSVRIDF